MLTKHVFTLKVFKKFSLLDGEIYEIDVDTNNSSGTFVTPYKTTVASDVPARLDFTTITVDSTLGMARVKWAIQSSR